MTGAGFGKSVADRTVAAAIVAEKVSKATGLIAADEIVHYCRVAHVGAAWTGRVRGEHIELFREDIFALWSGRAKAPAMLVPRRKARLLQPIMPRTVLAVGNNYLLPNICETHPVPNLYLKPPGAVIGPGATISPPHNVGCLQADGNMVVVIGRRGKHIAENKAGDHIVGVTCGNDVSERIWQRADLQWARARGADGFGPIGPVIAAGLDMDKLTIVTRVNGRLAQRGSTVSMLNSASAIIAFISRTMTLEPGDLIFTGSPGLAANIAPGDKVTVEIDGIGILANRIGPRAKQRDEIPLAKPFPT